MLNGSASHFGGGHAVAMNKDELLTMSEAAKALGVSIPTIKRWLKDGRIPTYRLGPRFVRIRRADLARALTPIVEPMSSASILASRKLTPITATPTVQPLTADEIAQLDAAIEGSQQVIARIRARRGGKPLGSSWPILREIREKRAAGDE
jgi:excisionase family DNA binding protein